MSLPGHKESKVLRQKPKVTIQWDSCPMTPLNISTNLAEPEVSGMNSQ